TPTLRPNRPENHTLTTAHAHLHTHGHTTPTPTRHQTNPTPLPTYPFQHQTYWLRAPFTSTDTTDLGLDAGGHPLLGAAVDLAGDDSVLFTGRISLRSQPWLADHTIADTVLLPAAAHLELALHAGRQLGAGTVEELTLQEPLVLAPEQTVQLQLVVAAPDASGARPFTIHSRPDGTEERSWTRHATGVVVPEPAQAAPAVGSAWPPAQAEAIDVTDFYADLADRGYAYGPAFQGLRAAWRVGDEVQAEVVPPGDVDTTGYGLHPALLDAALHTVGLAGRFTGDDPTQVRLPFAWSGVTLRTVPSGSVRVRTVPVGDDGLSLFLTDGDGRPVASIETIRFRTVSAQQLAAAASPRPRALLGLEWTPLAADHGGFPTGDRAVLGIGSLSGPEGSVTGHPDLAGLRAAVERGLPTPQAVVVPWPGTSDDAGEAVHAHTRRTLALLQEWLAESAFDDSRLIILTTGATGERPTDLAAA
ncbi:polyketide synthase dehydratase domain-containing protein, partial [Kitasatospora sp. NPDC059408]|uniref:polyketide synthase dehydratase domain-containing protein n=1 Tax=Kitasatospora sp. NPDC059408 TaxID=3346823 RepID=UPI0036C165FA